MKQDLLQAGFAAAKIHVVGIPIECPRKGRCNRQGILRRLKLDPEVPVLLLMGGGLGLGGIDAALAELEKLTCPVQFLVVAGKTRLWRIGPGSLLQLRRTRSWSGAILMRCRNSCWLLRCSSASRSSYHQRSACHAGAAFAA